MAQAVTVEATVLAERLRAVLLDAGASSDSAAACVRALMHASLLGVDSHGGAAGGALLHRAAEWPDQRHARSSRVTRRGAAAAVVDGDDGLGHYAAYRAMEEAVALAREAGSAPSGSCARRTTARPAPMRAPGGGGDGRLRHHQRRQRGVALRRGHALPRHQPARLRGAERRRKPWLLDMATSSIPFNRVFLYRSLGVTLPEGVAADGPGVPTRDPQDVAMLLPLGGADFGFKGAALAGVATILSAVLQGAALDHAMIRMVGGGDMTTPRGMGHFVMAIDPAFFGGRDVFAGGDAGLSRRPARGAGAAGRGGDGAGRPGVAGGGRAGPRRHPARPRHRGVPRASPPGRTAGRETRRARAFRRITRSNRETDA